jgi:deoxyribodipyrimidine photolyase-related protein
MKSALILYPHQLYAAEHLPEFQMVVLVEEPLYFGRDHQYPVSFHKQKLILHRASMRRYAEEVLWPLGVEVGYIDLDVFMKTGDVLEEVKKFDKVYAFDPVDDVLGRRLLQARREREGSVALEFLSNPNFYLKDQEIREYFGERHQHLFGDFYQWQRERFNILIGPDYKPVGGRWSFDTENKEKLPKDIQLPTFAAYGNNKWVDEAITYVDKHFPDNPGGTDFIWPTNHEEAAKWLQDFIRHRLDLFGPYEDAMQGQAAWLYHSALSSSLNIGLLSPQQVVDAALKRHDKEPVPLPSLESFIRQVIGWREFVRGQYIVKGGSMRTSNVLKHQRRLTRDWYDGSLEIPPFDDMVKKVNQHAYAHHIERLMIAGNLMTLCEIHPDDVYKWFNELFIDAYDWVMVPNVYGLSQFAEGGSMMSNPFVSASNYILQMSDYERGEWADIWDGLFWRFVDKHRELLKKNPRMRVMVQRLDRLDPDRKRIIHYRAEDFLAKYTS